jgi:hypothetical protein
MAKQKAEKVEQVEAKKDIITFEKEKTEDMDMPGKEKVVEEAKKQFGELMDDWSEAIFRIYRINNNELKISLSLHLDGNPSTMMVKTTMSFVTGKMTDEKTQEVNLKQPDLPGVKE